MIAMYIRESSHHAQGAVEDVLTIVPKPGAKILPKQGQEVKSPHLRAM